MLLALVYACYAETFDVPEEENVNKNVYVIFSETGIVRYGQMNIDKAFYELIGKPLGDINFNVAGFSFSLENMIVTSLTNPELSILLLPEEERGDANIKNLGLHLSFEFHLLHNTFPYMEDSGTGTLDFNVDSIHMLVWATESKDCPGAIYLNSTHSSAIIDKIDIAFQSSLSFIYDAILPFVSDFLKDFLNEKFSQIIVDELMQFANDYTGTVAPISHMDKNDSLSTDERYIGDVSIVDREFISAFGGTACILDLNTRYCARGFSLPAHPRCNFMMNADVTYELDANLFRQLLAFLWELNSSYLQENFNLSQITIDVVQVVNTGVEMRIEYVKDGEANTIEALAKVKPAEDFQSGGYPIMSEFTLQFFQVAYPGNIPLESATEFVLSLNDIMVDFSFTFQNGNTMDLEHSRVVYCDTNWVHVGVELRPDE